MVTKKPLLDSKIEHNQERLTPLERIIFRLEVHGRALGLKQITREINIAKTLLKLPSKVRKKTLDEVAFLNVDVAAGKTIWAKRLLKSKKKAIIILNPLPCASNSAEMNTIAHEIAHFILGHGRFRKYDRKQVAILGKLEKEADDLAVKWGFKQRYNDYDF